MPRGIIIALSVVMAWSCLSCRHAPYSLDLRIVVKGHVVDNAGRPVPGAKVQARLGLDLEGTAVETALDGGFVADASSDFWYKGSPSINAAAKGYAEKYTYFDRWEQGERQFEQTIVLDPSDEKDGS
ncbi:MAG TPA: carboxypeptidase-like regulatory domain-containing protein [Blastocatellia bacterium]|nr:carboxypeptidase-like regulatory domain-containing protein [Blastocatellia bacterium]